MKKEQELTRVTPAAVVAGDGGNAYDMALSLARASIPLVIISIGKWTDYFARTFGAYIIKCSNGYDSDDLIGKLSANRLCEHGAVIIPASDEFVIFFSKKRARIPLNFYLLQPKNDVVEACTDKIKFSELCARLDLKHPKCIELRNSDDIDRLEKFKPPFCLKPKTAGSLPKNILDKVIVVNDVDKVRDCCNRAWEVRSTIVCQEYIPGNVESLWMVCGLYSEDSEPEKIFIGRKKMDYPMGRGTASHAILEWNEEVVELANTFALKTGYCGPIDFEAKRNIETNELYIIEVNARFGQWHMASNNGKWDIVKYYYSRMIDGGQACSGYEPHLNGRKWMYPHRHLCSMIDKEGVWSGLKKWAVELRDSNEKCDWNTGDLARIIRHARVVVGHVRRKLMKV